jgi:hypothetical protein
MTARKIEGVVAAAVIAGFGFFAASHVQPSYAYKKRHTGTVHCSQSGIHATIGVDGKTWVITSATVCTNGNFKLEGKVK